MASETVLVSQQPSLSAVQSSTGSDDSSDEIGELVIDLGNDDAEKSSNDCVNRSTEAAICDLRKPQRDDINNNDISISPTSLPIDNDESVSAETTNNLTNNSPTDKAMINIQDLPSDEIKQISKAIKRKSTKPNKSKEKNYSQQHITEISDNTEIVIASENHDEVIKTPLPTIDVSVDAYNGKKTKTTKSKSHKKQSKYTDKACLNSNCKSDLVTKATKFKSKNSKKINFDKTSAFITSTTSHPVMNQDDTNNTSVNSLGKSSMSARRTASPNDNKNDQFTKKGRTPSRTALISCNVNPISEIGKHDKNLNDKDFHQNRKRQKRKQASAASSSHIDSHSNLTETDSSEQETSRPKRFKAEQEKKSSSPNSILSASEEADHHDYNSLKYDQNKSPAILEENENGFNKSKPLNDYRSDIVNSLRPKISTSKPATLNETTRGNMSSNTRSKMDKKSKSTSPPNRQTVATLTCTSDIGVMTEPDALGPCDPGTSVHLDGIVWHETDTGVLVVNVTWRNRTYVGTLLDATKHDLAPPRLLDSESDVELRGRLGRSQRLRGGISDNTRKSRTRGLVHYSIDDVKRSPSLTSKRKNKISESKHVNTNDTSASRSSAKSPRLAPSCGNKNNVPAAESQNEASVTGTSSSCSSPELLECPYPDCMKRYRDQDALKYHQAVACHSTTLKSNDSNEKDDNLLFSTSSTNKSNLKNNIGQSESSVELMNQDNVENRGKTSTESGNFQKPGKKLNTSDECFHSVGQNRKANHDATNNNSVSDSCNNLEEQKYSTSSEHVSNASKSTVLYAQEKKKDFYTSSSATITQNSTDMESVRAVETLLQIQNSDQSLLPSLSAPHTEVSFLPNMPTESIAPQACSNVLSSNNQPLLNLKSTESFLRASQSIVSQPQTVVSRVSTIVSLPISSYTVASIDKNRSNLKKEHQDALPTFARTTTNDIEPYSSFVKSTITNSDSKTIQGQSSTLPVSFEVSKSSNNVIAGGSNSIIESPKHQIDFKGNLNSFTKNIDVKLVKKEETTKQSPTEAKVETLSTSASLYNGQNICKSPPIDNNIKVNTLLALQYQPKFRSHLSPQNQNSSKVSGIISPASTSVHHNGTNVTVAGTFHPHREPIHPELSASACTQDKVSSDSSLSSTLPVSNQNINHKIHRAFLNKNKSITQNKTSSTANAAQELQKLSNQEHSKPITSSSASKHAISALKYPTHGIGLYFHDMMTIQNKVESAIADAYSLDLAKKSGSTKESSSPDSSSENSSRKSQVDVESNRPAEKQMKSKPEDERKADRELSFVSSKPPANSASKLSVSAHLIPSKRIQQESPLNMGGYNHTINSAHQNSLMLPTDKSDFKFRQQYEQLIQPMQNHPYSYPQQLLSQHIGEERKQQKSETHIKDSLHMDHRVKTPLRPSSAMDKPVNWQQINAKLPSTISPFSYTQTNKEKLTPPLNSTIFRHPHDVASDVRYKSPQPKNTVINPAPLRNQTLLRAQSPVVGNAAHLRTDSYVGRNSSKESDHLIMKHSKNPLTIDRTYEKIENSSRRSVGSPHSKQGHMQYYHSAAPAYPPIFDIRGVPSLAVAGIPAGYIFPPAMFSSNPGWPSALGRQSPKASKERIPPTRSPIRDEKPNIKSEVKPKEYPFPYSASEKKMVEGENHSVANPSPTPDSRLTSSALPKKPRSSPLASNHRGSPPTHRHHHTHHHIHGLYPYAATPVLAGADAAVAASYVIPYQKRE